jgi:hypothetical protein
MALSEINTTIVTNYLGVEQGNLQALFTAQPAMTQRFLERQAAHLAGALAAGAGQVKFSLPDRILAEAMPGQPGAARVVPTEAREQKAGGLRNRLEHHNLEAALRHRLSDLEHDPEPALATSARLLRFATARHMIHNMLPVGHRVKYIAPHDEAIPYLPVEHGVKVSAILAASDAIIEESSDEAGRGELQTPFVEAARRFFLPQWVAFDDQDRLLVSSEAEARACLASMQNYTHILHLAVALAPYIVADAEYQRKRYGILGQLVHQGRALARYYTAGIVQNIQCRAAEKSLNRGLNITLPYFNDQQFCMAETQLEVIPAGRILFWPAFMVLATRRKRTQVEQDVRLNPSTRRHLLAELRMLENAFKEVYA